MMVWEQKRERRHYTRFGAKIITTNVVKELAMAGSTSIRINQDLYEQAKQDAAIEHRSIAGQIEFWARVGRAALDNPDLPVSFIAESLASLAEPRESAQAFVPRSSRSK
ncbi:ParD-like family protein [Duganella sp. CY15W]|uniref:ParD-like family protein n=1 Tax=Duganella sp. CY15W TaxID=2692172 RepID=UPI001E4FC9C4|nr:ParD-like family protein [Duganella sp. CY15W]